VANEKNREKTAQRAVDTYVKKGNAKSRKRVFIVHRLDRDTSGVVIFAKSIEMKKMLQENWKVYTKMYEAVIHGVMKEKSGMLTSYLMENSVHKMYATRDREKGKRAETEYRVVREGNGFSFVSITLHTGRKNQIRVQFADISRPVYGDKKYGRDAQGTKRLALHAAAVHFLHPISGDKMVFEAPTPVLFKNLLK
jgi:tRNA pseudouridine32 synthase/23S rRNA pseudouridine746 synthase/23S rRNA pseudouridine1911/1915/1917 synthase